MKYTFSTLFLLFHTIVQAQFNIELPYMNALYECVDNELTIVTEHLPDSCLRLLPTRGAIRRDDQISGKYYWKIIELDTHIVFLNIWDKKADTLVTRRDYRLKAIMPEPTVVMPQGHSSGGVAMLLPNFQFDQKVETLGFDVFANTKSCHNIIHNNGAKFNDHIQNMLKSAVPGDKLVFFNFKYQVCNGDVRYLNAPVVFEHR